MTAIQRKTKNAKLLKQVTYLQVLEKGLKVMDSTAIFPVYGPRATHCRFQLAEKKVISEKQCWDGMWDQS